MSVPSASVKYLQKLSNTRNNHFVIRFQVFIFFVLDLKSSMCHFTTCQLLSAFPAVSYIVSLFIPSYLHLSFFLLFLFSPLMTGDRLRWEWFSSSHFCVKNTRSVSLQSTCFLCSSFILLLEPWICLIEFGNIMHKGHIGRNIEVTTINKLIVEIPASIYVLFFFISVLVPEVNVQLALFFM